MLETIKYNKVDPVIKWAQFFITVASIKQYPVFHKTSLEFREVLFGVHI